LGQRESDTISQMMITYNNRFYLHSNV
jgi:hypothetical protein